MGYRDCGKTERQKDYQTVRAHSLGEMAYVPASASGIRDAEQAA